MHKSHARLTDTVEEMNAKADAATPMPIGRRPISGAFIFPACSQAPPLPQVAAFMTLEACVGKERIATSKHNSGVVWAQGNDDFVDELSKGLQSAIDKTSLQKKARG